MAPGETVIASVDPVALDAYCLDFLDLFPDDVPHLEMGEQRGIGVVDWESLTHREVQVG